MSWVHSRACSHQIHPLAVVRSAQSLRVLAFSDCRVQDLDAIISWIVGRPEKPDLIIYAGDDVRRFVPDPKTNYFEQLAALSTHGIVAVVGNDDLPEYRNLIGGHKVYEIHSRPVTIGRFLVVGVEGAPILENGIGLGPTSHAESEISDHLHRCIPKDTNTRSSSCPTRRLGVA